MTSFPKMDAIQVQSKYIDGSAKGRRTLVDGAGRELAVIQSEKYHGLSPEVLAHEIAFRLRLCAKLQAEHDALRQVNADLLAALEAAEYRDEKRHAFDDLELFFNDPDCSADYRHEYRCRERQRAVIAKAKGIV